MRRFKWLWVLGAGLLASCASNQPVVAPAPAWVTETPVTPGYYVGTGAANKLVHAANASAVAQQSALDNLSREIRVQVQSTSTMKTLQVDGWLTESFSQQSNSTTQEDLEGFELVDSYESETETFVYYRLSKAKHAQIQEAKRLAAMDLAVGHLASANDARSASNVQQAVDASIRGLDVIRPFMDRPLVHIAPDGTETAVAQDLVAMLDGCVAGLSLASSDSILTLRVGNSFRGEAQVTALLDGKPAPNVTLTYRYNRGKFPTRGEAVTDANGVAHIVLEKFEPGMTSTILEARVDPMAFVQGLALMHPFRQAAQGLQSPPLRLRVELAPVEVVLTVEERGFGKKRDQAMLAPALKQALQKGHVRLVAAEEASEEAMAFLVQADARPGGEGQGFYTVYVDLVGTVTNGQGETVFTQTLTQIKGIQLDLPRATDKAYQKASSEVQEDFVPALIRLWHGF